MRIVNVVVIRNEVVDTIDSFPIFEEQLSQEVVEQAETFFINKIKKYDGDFTEDDTECLLDEGYYSGMNFSVCLCWSDIN